MKASRRPAIQHLGVLLHGVDIARNESQILRIQERGLGIVVVRLGQIAEFEQAIRISAKLPMV